MARWANPVLESLWLLSLCSITWAGLHRLSCFQLISPKATPGLPKRLSVLRVNNLVLAAYDGDSGRLVPRNGYSPEDQEFWSKLQAWYQDWDSWVETTYQALVREMNASAPRAEPYYMQVLQTCDMHEATGAVRVVARYALNGEEVLRYQSDQNRWVPVHPAAGPIARRWNEEGESFEVMNVHTVQQYRNFLGLTAPFTAQQTAQPTARVTRVPGTQARPRRLVCHVTGFYPRDIAVSWKRWGRRVRGEQLSSGMQPNGDPTFQIQVSIELGQEGPSPTEYVCEVRHRSLGDRPLRVICGHLPSGLTRILAIIFGLNLAAVGLRALCGYLSRKPAAERSETERLNGPRRPATASSHGEPETEPTPQCTQQGPPSTPEFSALLRSGKPGASPGSTTQNGAAPSVTLDKAQL